MTSIIKRILFTIIFFVATPIFAQTCEQGIQMLEDYTNGCSNELSSGVPLQSGDQCESLYAALLLVNAALENESYMCSDSEKNRLRNVLSEVQAQKEPQRLRQLNSDIPDKSQSVNQCLETCRKIRSLDRRNCMGSHYSSASGCASWQELRNAKKCQDDCQR